MSYRDTNPTISEIVSLSHQLSRDKGWYEGYGDYDGDGIERVPEKLCLAHSELSEALEEYRRLSKSQWPLGSIRLEGPDSKPEGFVVELADVVIRIADLCGWLGLDLGKAITVKHAYNATRPHRHGGKVC